MATRYVHLKVAIQDDGSVGMFNLYRKEEGGAPLSPEEWEAFKEAVAERLPALVTLQAREERKRT